MTDEIKKADCMMDILEVMRGRDEHSSQRAADEIERNRAAIEELISAGNAVVERWESPLWKDLPHTGEFIYALRDVIEKHRPTTTKEAI